MPRQLRTWTVFTGAASLGGYTVAAATSRSTPPFAPSVFNYIGWFTFVMASLTFVVLVGAALLEKLVRSQGPPRGSRARRAIGGAGSRR